MPWRIKTYILVESDDEPVFESKEEAEAEKHHLEFMQPENQYFVEEVDEEGGKASY